MSESRFTAQEMREVAEGLVDSCVADNISILVGHGNLKVVAGDRIVAMLRQAADAEEELAKAKRPDACPANPTNKMCYLPGAYCCDTVRYLQNENAKLKSRLEAVVKECSGVKWDEKTYVTIDTSTAAVDHNKDIDAILRAARGESETENKQTKKRKTKMETNEVGNKYRIFDAKTGQEKKGKYFCLRIDANDPVERDIVNGALAFYANMQDNAGRCDYAENIRKFIAARGEEGL